MEREDSEMLCYTPETNTGGQENTSLAGVSNKRRPLNLSRALRCKSNFCLCSDDLQLRKMQQVRLLWDGYVVQA